MIGMELVEADAARTPARVLCDLDTLETLPPREMSAGLAEVIKYGAIRDPGLFEWLEVRAGTDGFLHLTDGGSSVSGAGNVRLAGTVVDSSGAPIAGASATE